VRFSTCTLKGSKSGISREIAGDLFSGSFKADSHPSATLITLSLVSAVFWVLIMGFYIGIGRYEEHLFNEAFGIDYLEYKKKTGLLFPKLF